MAKFFGKGKKSFLKGIKKLSKRNLQLEPLEERQLLSVNPIWSAEKSVNNAESGTALTLEFEDDLHNLQSAVFAIRVSAGNEAVQDSELDPGSISIENKDNREGAWNPVVKGFFSNYKGTNDSVLLVELKPGDYNITVKGENNSTGSFTCEVFLPGDFGEGNTNTYGSTTSLVDQSESKLFAGAMEAHRLNDSYATVTDSDKTRFQRIYGQSFEWFRANTGLFDINDDGQVDTSDLSIVSMNYSFSNAMKEIEGYNNQDGINNAIKLVADNTGPTSEVDINPDDETGTKTEDGQIYASSLKHLTGTVTDSDGSDSRSAIKKIDIIIKGKDPLNPNQSKTWIITIDKNSEAWKDNVEDGSVTVDFNELNYPGDLDPDSQDQFNVSLVGTDEYDNSNIQHDENGNVKTDEVTGDPLLSEGVTELSEITVNVNPAPDLTPSFSNNTQLIYDGSEKADEESKLNYTVDLKTLVGTLIVRKANDEDGVSLAFGGLNDANELVFAGDEEGIDPGWIERSYAKDFAPETTDPVSVEVFYQYRVFKNGKLELKITSGAEWLTENYDNELNKLILELNIAVTDAYHGTSEETSDWAVGVIKIKIDPANDAPEADLFEDDVLNTTDGTELDILSKVTDVDRWDHISLSKINNYEFSGNDPAYATLRQDASEPKVWYIDAITATKPTDGKYIILTRIDADIVDKPQIEHLLEIDVNDYFNDLVEDETVILVFDYTAKDDSNVTDSANARITIKGDHTPPAIVQDQTFFISLSGGVIPGLIHTYKDGVITRDHGYVEYSINESWENGQKVKDDATFTLGKARFSAGDKTTEINAGDLFYIIQSSGEIYCESLEGEASLANYIETEFGSADTVTMTIEVTVKDEANEEDTGTITVTVMKKGIPVVDNENIIVDSGRTMSEDAIGSSSGVDIDQSLLHGLWGIAANADEDLFSQLRTTVTDQYVQANCYQFSSISLNIADSMYKANADTDAVNLDTEDELLVWAPEFFQNDQFAWTDLEDYVKINSENGVFSIYVESDTFGFLGRDQSILLAFDVTISDKDFSDSTVTRTMYVTVIGANDAPVVKTDADLTIDEDETSVDPDAKGAADYVTDVDYQDAFLFGSFDVARKSDQTLDYTITGTPDGRSVDDIRTALIARAGGEGNLENYLKSCLTLNGDGTISDNHYNAADGSKFDFLRANEKIEIRYNCTVGNKSEDFTADPPQVATVPAKLAITGTTTKPTITDPDTPVNFGTADDTAGAITGTGIYATDIEGYPLSLADVVINYASCTLNDVPLQEEDFEVSSDPDNMTDGRFANITSSMLSIENGNLKFNYGQGLLNLAQGETLVLSFSYKVNNTIEDSAGSKTVTCTITGTNQAPVLTENPVETPLPITVSDNSYDEDLTIDDLRSLGLTDADWNESFTFYKLGDIEITTVAQTYTDSDGKTWGTFWTDSDKTTLYFKADPSFKYGLGENEKEDFAASLIVKDSKGLESNSADFHFQLVGVYNAPTITDVDLTISDSYGGECATVDQLSSFQTIIGQVDHNLTGEWNIESVTWKDTTDSTQTDPSNWTEWNAYFSIEKDTTENAKIQFKDVTKRNAFKALFDANTGSGDFKGKDYTKIDFTFTVRLIDNSDNVQCFDEKEIKLNVIDKMPPKVITTDLTMPSSVNEDVDVIPGADLTTLVVTEADDVDDPQTGTWWKFGNFKVNVTKTWDSVTASLKSLDAAKIEEIKDIIATLDVADEDLWDSSSNTAKSYSIALVDQFDFLAPNTSITLYYTIDVIDTQYGCATPVEISTVITGLLDVPTPETDPVTVTINDTDTALSENIAFTDLFKLIDAVGASAFYNFDISVEFTYSDADPDNLLAPFSGFDDADGVKNTFKDLIRWNATSNVFELTNDSAILDKLKEIPQCQNVQFTFSVIAKNGTSENADTTGPATIELTVNGTNQNPTADTEISKNLNEMGNVSITLSNIHASDIDFGDTVTFQQTDNNVVCVEQNASKVIFNADCFNERLYKIEAKLATITPVMMNSMLTISEDDDTLTFTAGDQFNFLRAGESVSFSYNVKVQDQHSLKSQNILCAFTLHGLSTKPVITFLEDTVFSEIDDSEQETVEYILYGDDVEGHDLSLGTVTLSEAEIIDASDNTVVYNVDQLVAWLGKSKEELEAMLVDGTSGKIKFVSGENFLPLPDGYTLTLNFEYTVKYTEGENEVESDNTQGVVVTIKGTNQVPTINENVTIERTITETGEGETTLYRNDTSLNAQDIDKGETEILTFEHYEDITVSQTVDSEVEGVRTVSELTTVLQSILSDYQDENPEKTDQDFYKSFIETGTSISFTPGETFKFLREGESITITYQFKMNDGKASSENALTYAVTITGVNTLFDYTEADSPTITKVDSDTDSKTVEYEITTIDVEGRSLAVDEDSIELTDAKIESTDNAFTTIDSLSEVVSWFGKNVPEFDCLGYDENTKQFVFNDFGAFTKLNPDEVLTLTFSYKVTNGALTPDDESYRVTVTINGTNQAPTVIVDGQTVSSITKSVDENGSPITLEINDTDLGATDVDHNDVMFLTDFVYSNFIIAAAAGDGERSINDIKNILLARTGANNDNDEILRDYFIDLLDDWNDQEVNFTPDDILTFLRAGESITINYTFKVSDSADDPGKTDNITLSVIVWGVDTAPVDPSGAGTTENPTHSEMIYDYAEGENTVELSTDVTIGNVDDYGNVSLVNRDLISVVLKDGELEDTSVTNVDTLLNYLNLPESTDLNSCLSYTNDTFTFDRTAFKWLPADKTLELIYRYKLTNGKATGNTEYTFKITITGTNQAPEINTVENPTITLSRTEWSNESKTWSVEQVLEQNSSFFADDHGDTEKFVDPASPYCTLAFVPMNSEVAGYRSINLDDLFSTEEQERITNSLSINNDGAISFTHSEDVANLLKRLRTGERIVATYTFKLQDNGDLQSEEGSLKIEFQGMNDSLVINTSPQDIILNQQEASTVIDWYSHLTNIDAQGSQPGSNDAYDGMVTLITKIGEVDITCGVNNFVEQTISVSDPVNGTYGNLTITWDCNLMRQIVKWEPNTNNEYVKWNSSGDTEMIDIGSFEFTIQNKYYFNSSYNLTDAEDVGSPVSMTFNLQIYDDFDPLEFNTNQELEVVSSKPADETGELEGYVEVGKVTFQCENSAKEDYEFTLRNIGGNYGVTNKIKFINNGDRTATVYVLQTAMTDSEGLLKVKEGAYNISLEWTDNKDQNPNTGNATFNLTVKAKSAPNVVVSDPDNAPLNLRISEEYSESETRTLDVKSRITVTDPDDSSRSDDWWYLSNFVYANPVLYNKTGDIQSLDNERNTEISGWQHSYISMNTTLDDAENGLITVDDYSSAPLKFLKDGDTLKLNYTATVTDKDYTGATKTIDITIEIIGQNTAPTTDGYTGTLNLGENVETLTINISDLGHDEDDGIDVSRIKILGYATAEAESRTWVTLSTAADQPKEVWLETISTYAKAGSRAKITLNSDGTLTFAPGDSLYSLEATDPVQAISWKYILFDNYGDVSSTEDETAAGTATVNVTGNYTAPEWTTLPATINGTVETDPAEGFYHEQSLDLSTMIKAKDVTYSYKLYKTGEDANTGTNEIQNPVILSSLDLTNGVLSYTFMDKSDYAPDLDLSGCVIRVTATDSVTCNSASQNINVSLKEQYTTNIALVYADDLLIRDTYTGFGTTTGTVVKETYNGYQTYYMSADNFTSLKSKTDSISSATLEDQQVYFVDIWVQDIVNQLYDKNISGLNSIQLQFNFDSTMVSDISLTSFNDPYTGNFIDSVGLMKTSEISFARKFNDDGRIAYALMYGGTQVLNKGMDGTAMLLARVKIVLKNTGTNVAPVYASISDLGLTVTGITKEDFQDGTAEVGFGYQRIDGGTLNGNQISIEYPQVALFSNLTGRNQTEMVVDHGIYVRTVTEKTETDLTGSVDALSANVDFVNEWESHYAELWVKLSDSSWINGASVDFGFDNGYFNAADIEFGSAFTNGSFTIDNETGQVTGIQADIANGVMRGDGYVLLARIKMEAVVNGGVAADEVYTPYSLGWSLENGFVRTLDGTHKTYLGKTSSTELWGIAYDTNDDGIIGVSDFTFFTQYFGMSTIDGNKIAAMVDFNNDGLIGVSDFTLFPSMFGFSQSAVSEGRAKINFPETFNQRFIGSTLETEDDVAWVGVILDKANAAWQTALDLENPIKVQLIVKDLGGQTLAEARITEYNDDETPAAGVIYLDNDALGNTWYTQMATPETGTEKYDLYTVLLHELGHLYGYESHSANANDVMSSILNPGQRKTLTENEIATLLDDVYQAEEASGGSVMQSELPNGSSIVNTDLPQGSNEIVILTDETNDRLQAIGLNLPGAEIVPSQNTMNDAVITEIYLIDEEDDEDDNDDLDLSNLVVNQSSDPDYEKSLDIVLEELLD